MKRINIIIPGVLLLASFGIADRVFGGIDIDVNVGDSSRTREREINVLVGEQFSIALPMSQTEGYVWQLEKTPGHEIRLVDRIRCAPQDMNAGYCTEERWTYEAVDEGKTTIKFRLIQPGDPDHYIDRIAYKIHVHD